MGEKKKKRAHRPVVRLGNSFRARVTVVRDDAPHTTLILALQFPKYRRRFCEMAGTMVHYTRGRNSVAQDNLHIFEDARN